MKKVSIFHIDTASKWPKPITNLVMAESYRPCLQRGADHLGKGVEVQKEVNRNNRSRKMEC